MKVEIASDHAGFKLKESLRAYLQSQKHEVADMGTDSETSVDYPDFAKPVAAAVSSGDADMGVLICGSGIGMAITANRLKNVRAVVLNDELDAKASRKHNNANVACLGARKISEVAAKKLLKIWLETEFEGGRHERRVEKIG